MRTPAVECPVLLQPESFKAGRGEVYFEGITVERTGWLRDIRYYDCPMGKTTTFPLQITLNKKATENRGRKDCVPWSPLVDFRQCTT